MTDAQLLAELERVARRAGATEVTKAHVRKHSAIMGTRILETRFGSFAAALAAAGLQSSHMTRRYTEVDLAHNFRAVAQRLGRTPRVSDMNRPPSTITPKTYTYRYGPWAVVVERLTSKR